MKVWVKYGTPTATFHLCQTDKESPSGMVISGERVVQWRRYFRGLTASPKARQNRSLNVSFSVTRLHETEAAAAAYVLTHNDDLPDGGDIYFSETSGGVTIQRVIRSGVISQTQQRVVGASSIHSYTILGGKMEIET